MKSTRSFMIMCSSLILTLVINFTLFVNGYAADQINVGVIGPMKFDAGKNILMGAQLAAEELNANGGVLLNGKKLKIVLHEADDNSILSIPDAANAMQRLVNVKKVKYVIGGLYSEAVMAQMEIMGDNKVLYLCTSAVNEQVSEKLVKNYDRYKYWFRVTTLNAGDVALNLIATIEPAIRAMRSSLGIEKPKVALLMDEALWTVPSIEMLKKVLPEMKCELAGIWKTSIKASSMTAELSAIKSAGAHIIIQANAGPAGVVLSRQWGEMQIPAALVGSNVESMQTTHWATTDGKCNYMGSMDFTGSAIKTNKTEGYLSAFAKKFGGNTPLYTAGAAYDSLYILAEAIAKSGSTETDALIPVLEKTNHIGPLGRIVFAGKDSKTPHATLWGPDLSTYVGIQWKEGKQIAFWPNLHEIHPSLIALGAPKGWDKVRFEGTQEYVLPPWVVEYWKDKK